MIKKTALILTVLLILMFLTSMQLLQAATGLDIKLRVYEGTRQGTIDPPEFVTSSYIQPTINANLRLSVELAEEMAQIRNVFNLADVKILTETELRFEDKGLGKVKHHFRLNGHAYDVHVQLKEWRAGGRFLVLVNETAAEGQEKKLENVLTTEMLLHGGHSAVFGFEDRKGKPYFVSFLITGPADKIVPPPPPPPVRPTPPVPPAPPIDPEKIEEFEKGAIKARDAVNPPKLIKRVDPIYPEEARISKTEGTVILNIRTDVTGQVERVLVLRGVDAALDKAAADAVKQWKYEPFVQNGEPKPVVFSVTVRFRSKESILKSIEVGGEIAPPVVVKRVDPVYPEEARKDGIQGSVILYVTTDEEGRVKKVEVLKSIPALDKAAVDAVRQWVYEPYLKDGVPKPVSFAITVQFRLQ
ncbi:MAG: energy transducer TonB [Candidatus Aminicenantaceae bacterium]